MDGGKALQVECGVCSQFVCAFELGGDTRVEIEQLLASKGLSVSVLYRNENVKFWAQYDKTTGRLTIREPGLNEFLSLEIAE